MKEFFAELKRRHVFRVGIAYLVVTWLAVQLVNNLIPIFGVPIWIAKAVLTVLIVGFPVAIVMAWAFEVTPEGVKRTDKRAPTMPAAIEPVNGAAPELSTVPEGQTTPSIAVLPFADLSPDKDQEYFADGITEELLNSLARIRDLQVTGRTSSFYFKGKNEDLRTIAEKLGVENLLEGSVRKSGEHVRITAQLINARTGYHLWSKTYDRKFDDIFAVEDEIARGVAEALEITLGVGDLGQVEGATKNVDAYNEFLRGRALSRQRAPEAVTRAIDHFERAIDLDPSFALPWAALADPYGYWTATDVTGHVESWTAKRSAALARARELAPNAPAILVATAIDYQARHQWLDAERAFQTAVARGAKVLAEIDYRYGSFLLCVGRVSEAIEYARRHLRAEPLDPYAYTLLTMVYAAGGAIDDALAEYERGISLIGGQIIWLRGDALVLTLVTGNRSLIEERLDALIKFDTVGRSINTAMRSLLDDRPGAMAKLRRMVVDPAFDSPIQHYIISQWAAYFGDVELSLETFKAIVVDVGDLVARWTQPILQDLRKRSGFKDLLRDLGLVDYWRTTGRWPDLCRPVGDDDFECT